MNSVSVVVPFFNRSEFLERLLDGVLNQTVLSECIFIVDNGSKYEDILNLSSIIALDKFKMLNLILVSTMKKGNANYARNLGYELAQTKYVAFLDSDDWWTEKHLENSISSLKITNKVAVYSGAIVHTKNRVFENSSIDVKRFNNPFDLILSSKGYLAQTSSYIVDKQAIGEKVIWDNNFKRHQDFDYFSSIFYKTSGWCYSPYVNVHIDWDTGGANKKEIDFYSIIFFYNKWRLSIPKHIKKTYLLGMLRMSYRYSSPSFFKKYFLDQIVNNSYFDSVFYKVKTKMVSIRLYYLIIDALDFFNLKSFLKRVINNFS